MAASGSTTCACPATRCSTATATSASTAATPAPREPVRAVLHDARDLGPGASASGWPRPRQQVRARGRGPLRAPAPAVRPPKGPEIPLLDYVTHQRRLLPALATTVALDIAMRRLVEDCRHTNDADTPQRERRRSKRSQRASRRWPLARNRHDPGAPRGLRRRGLSRHNRFAALKADTDVFTTFEGDNTVLLQLVAKT